MMVPSRWEKQNFSIRNTGFALSVITGGLLAVIFAALGFGKPGIVISILVVLLGFIVTLILSNRKPKLMVRILNLEYETIERDFRVLFKNNYIRYMQREEDDGYRFEFPGHALTMTVQPYAPHKYVFGTRATVVRLGEVDARNEEFAAKLANLVDEMVNSRAAAAEET